jgi:splicing factor U2AF subunit
MQQTRHARRIYVGGLEHVPEEEIAAFFDGIVRAALINPLPRGVNPVLSVYINPERKFAFVELYSIELATALMKCDGLQYKGQALKIRRPHDYKPESLPVDIRDKVEPLNFAALPLPEGAAAAAASSMSGGGHGSSSSANKIFIGGLPTGMSESDLTELMKTFGDLKSINVLKNPDGTHKGYGFCEYLNGSLTDVVIAQLNGMEIAGKKLTVSRAKQSQSGGGGGGGSSSGPSMGSYAITGTNNVPLGMPRYVPPTAASGVNVLLPQGAPSPVLCLENMASPAELVDDAQYRDLVEDVAGEAAKYGPMRGLQVPRPPMPGTGRVFLHYADVPTAVRAATELAGRRFGDNTVVARYYDESTYLNGVFTA